MRKGNLANVDSTKKWIIVDSNSAGFIQDLDGHKRSFNVYSGSLQDRTQRFYKSAYDLEKAKRFLKELTDKADPIAPSS